MRQMDMAILSSLAHFLIYGFSDGLLISALVFSL